MGVTFLLVSGLSEQATFPLCIQIALPQCLGVEFPNIRLFGKPMALSS
jgi:hypothetical protein